MSTDVTTNNAPVATAPSLGTTGQQQTSRNIFGGDLGQLPVVAALVLMTIYFNIDSQGLFLSPRNLSNLTLQTTVVGITALASVLVLLLGEIDLSIAAVSNLCGAVMCVFSVYHGWGVIPSILAGMVVGAVIGFVNGIIVSVIRVPSFIVTLAGFLGYEGVLQHVLQPNDSIRISDQGLLGIASGYMPEYLSIA